MKEVLSLPREVLEERFGVRGNHGVDVEVLGCTRGIPGGGFVYTNLDSLSVGVVVSLEHLAVQLHPGDLRHHQVAQDHVVAGAELEQVERVARAVHRGDVVLDAE